MKTKTKKIILKRVKENLGSAWEKGYQNFDELNEEEEDLLGIVEFAMNEARQEGIEEALELIKYDEKHAPKSPQDITIMQQGGWYLGRIDGLQSVETKLEVKISELKKKEKE